jgi:ribosomal-protein-alanine N-acetyltransferase
MDKYKIKMMNDHDARIIAKWEYEAPYDFYNMENDLEDLEELLDSEARKDAYYSAFDEQNRLSGFFCFEEQVETVEIGLGMRPDLTGKGAGEAFLKAGLSFANEKFKDPHFSLAVATFNKRALKVYERVGFEIEETMMVKTNGGVYPFYSMVQKVEKK